MLSTALARVLTLSLPLRPHFGSNIIRMMALEANTGTSDNPTLRPEAFNPSKSRKKPARGVAVTKDAPHQWWKQLRAIEWQRSARNAPVDYLGCHTLGDRDDGPTHFRFQTLLALVLSPRTTDPRVADAMQTLRYIAASSQEEGAEEGGPLSAAVIASCDVEVLSNALSGVTFGKVKAERIKQLSRTLVDEYGGDVPETMPELLALPGVGPKVGHLLLQIGWEKTEGIAVDTHVHRIARRLGWTRGAKDAEASRKQLEAWLPKEHWQSLNPLLVGFGQQVCADTPRCRSCRLAAERLCPQIGLEAQDGRVR